MVYQGRGIVELPETDWLYEHGGEAAYKYMNIPSFSSSKWEDAAGSHGEVNFSKPSRIPGGYSALPHKRIDFTYFRTIVEIPESEIAKITSFKAIIKQVDDGARMYIVNKKFKDGKHIPSADAARGGLDVTADFTNDLVVGLNAIVIVQFDQNPIQNNLTGGIAIKINGKSIKTNTSLPVPSTIYKLTMSTIPKIDRTNNKQATGTINGIGYTYISSKNIEVEDADTVYGFNKFPKDQNIPVQKSIRNSKASKNTIRFDQEISDPVLVFASIGNEDKEVDITFQDDIEIVYQENLTYHASKIIRGKEGYAVVKIEGLHREIKFDYGQDEKYVHFMFGACI